MLYTFNYTLIGNLRAANIHFQFAESYSSSIHEIPFLFYRIEKKKRKGEKKRKKKDTVIRLERANSIKISMIKIQKKQKQHISRRVK